MSEATVRTAESTRNKLVTDYDFSKIFVFDNIFRTVRIPNNTGTALELKRGTAIGQVSGVYQVYKSGTSNISLIGVCAEDVTVSANDATGKDVAVCIGGTVAEEKIILDGTDTLATVVTYIPIRDRFASDTLGINIIPATELTGFDN